MFPAEIFREPLLKLVAVLNKYAIPFHLTGGVTSIVYGEPRMTQDIDIVVDPDTFHRHLAEVTAEIDRAGFLVDPQSLNKAVQTGGMFQLLDPWEALKLDIYLRQLIPGELSRSVKFEVFKDAPLPIVSRADAVLSKLIWVSKGSHKSRHDLRQIYSGCDNAERSQIDRIAGDLKLTGLLGELLSESDEFE